MDGQLCAEHEPQSSQRLRHRRPRSGSPFRATIHGHVAVELETQLPKRDANTPQWSRA